MRASIAGAVVALALLGGCGEGTDDSPAPQADEWPVVVTDGDLGVEFRLPAEPDRLVQRLALPDGTQSELVVYSAMVDERELFVSVLPLDPDTYELSVAAPGAANAVGGELLTVRPVSVAGRPGRDAEIRFQRDGTGQLLLYRAVLLEEGLLQLQTLGAEVDRAALERDHDALVDGVSWG